MRGSGTQKVQQLLSQTEIEGLQDEKKELQSTLREIESGAGQGTSRGVDVGMLKKQIASIDAAIAGGTAATPRAVDKERLVKEEKELEDKIAKGMPTQYEMRYPTKNPGAVRKHMEWSKRNQSFIERYVQIQRILRPFEPKSIENLRAEK